LRRRRRPKTRGRGSMPPFSLLKEKPEVGAIAASLIRERYGDKVG
jgi:hypothetical protein